MSDIDLNAMRTRFADLARGVRNTGIERAAFEEWAAARKFDITPNDACGYESESTAGAWYAWGVMREQHYGGVLALLDRLESAEQERDALKAEMSAPMIESGSQNWAALSGGVAYHLIERHAESWADVDKMMNEWAQAKGGKDAGAETASKAVPNGADAWVKGGAELPSPEEWAGPDETNFDGYDAALAPDGGAAK